MDSAMQKKITVNYEASGLQDLTELENLANVHESLLSARDAQKYENPFSFVFLPFDQAYFLRIQLCAVDKQALDCAAVVVIGIGGSSLGLRAILEAVHGACWNELETPWVHFADTLDPLETNSLLQLIEKKLAQSERILLVVISKTGTTLESVVHYAVFSALLRHYHPSDYHQYVVVISGEHSGLADYARQKKITFLPIPEPIGGRYSVFSAVGMFVCALCGLDIEQLRLGACSVIDHLFAHSLEKNDAALSALCIYNHYRQGDWILDYFVFMKSFAGIGGWYRQLVGESLGKERIDKTLCKLVPTVSVGSNDLHAVVQLYLGGLPPMFTQFVMCQQYIKDVPVCAGDFGKNLSHHTYGSLMNVLFQATKRAYDERKLPYVLLQIPENSSFYVGQLLQFHMMQVVYLGTLLGVNTFDQPHVELYKKYTHQQLN
jgi:glucose-6-phosphate isomerase